MLLGRRTEGNSIWGGLVECQGYSKRRVDYLEEILSRLVRQSLAVSAWVWNQTDQSVVLGQEYGDSCVYLADCQGDQHIGNR